MAELSWKSLSGRQRGAEGYRFGDVTRSLFRAVQGDAEAGGVTGVCSYAVRSLLAPLGGRAQDGGGEGGRGGGGADDVPPPHQMFDTVEVMLAAAQAHSATTGHATALPEDGPLGPNRSPVAAMFWLNFFNAVYLVGLTGLMAGLVDPDDVICCEPSLFLGLPALAYFECILRSVGAPGFLLSNGERVDREAAMMAEMDPEGKAILEAAEQVKALLEEHGLTDADLTALRKKIVSASGEAAECEDPEADAHANRIASKAIAAATTLSQLPFFRALFMLVFAKLAEEAPPAPDIGAV